MTELYINENLFEEVPEAVKNLDSLEILGLSGNPISERLSE
ncbi:MAG: hypothetical protein ACTSUT_16110 [Promethearchaeota archaeon]